MRILFDARHIKDFGFGTYIRNLLRSLAAVGSRHAFVLLAHRKDQHEFDALPPNFEPVFTDRDDTNWFNQIGFPLLVRSHKADLVHLPLNLVPWAVPKPYVVTVHDLSSLLYEPRKYGLRYELRLRRARRGLKRASRIIAVSDATRRDITQVLGIPAEAIRRIYSAPDAKYLNHTPGSTARAAGPEAPEFEHRRILERYQIKEPYLLYAGAIRPMKNIPRMVEAFALLKNELAGHPVYGPLKLLIIGDVISQYPQVRKAVVQSHVEHAVRFLGFVPVDTLRVFFAEASAFVFPSLYEGFGLPPLEAMALGTPVVTSNVSSLPEVVGDAAVTVNPENVFEIMRGMREVLLDEELRQTLVERGYERLRKFSWERTAREVLETYNEALAC